MGGAIMALQIALSVLIPLILTPLGFTNGQQADTRLVFSEDALAVAHMDGDPDDAGLQELGEFLIALAPELKAASRRAQGAPEWVAELDAQRIQMKDLQAWIDLPRQITVSLEPPGADAGTVWLGAANPSQAGRLLDWAMAAPPFFVGLFGHDVDETYHTMEYGGETLRALKPHDGQKPVFYDSLDSTILFGSAAPDRVLAAMARLIDGEPPTGPLHSVVAASELNDWAVWGATLMHPDALFALAPGSCLAELDPHQTPALTAGMDVRWGDRFVGELRALHPGGGSPVEAAVCLRQLCTELDEDWRGHDMSVRCALQRQPGVTVAEFTVEGFAAMVARKVREIEG